jgi:hypothetical protein
MAIASLPVAPGGLIFFPGCDKNFRSGGAEIQATLEEKCGRIKMVGLPG